MKTVKIRQLLFYFLAILMSLSMVSCDLFNDDKDDTNPDPVFEAEIDTLINTQEEIANLLQSKLLSTDTITAINDVVSQYANDPNISDISATPEGIVIHYKSGLVSLILVAPGEELGGFKDDGEIYTRGGITPGHPRVLFLNSGYANIQKYGQPVQSAYENNLGKPKYSLEVRTGPSFNLDFLTDLSGYGVIQFFSHGMLSNGNPERSFLMIGEQFDKFNYNSILNFQQDFQDGDVAFSTKLVDGNLVHRFAITPEFILKYNTFAKDSTLILGGFCYSGIDNWVDKMINAGALGYLGYDWRVGASSWRNWTTDMIVQMCDTSKALPMTIGDWIDLEKRIYVSSDPVDPKNGVTDLVYAGSREVALWEVEELTDILRVDVDLFIDDAEFKFVMDSSTTYGNGAHRAFISSREGTSTYNDKTRVWTTTFNKSWFGTEYSGTMTVTLGASTATVNLTRTGTSSAVTEIYNISKSGVPYSSAQSTPNTRVYYQNGTAACSGMITSYSRTSDNVTETLNDYQCGAMSYFKIEVVYQ